jgi:hypothetical protein
MPQLFPTIKFTLITITLLLCLVGLQFALDTAISTLQKG